MQPIAPIKYLKDVLVAEEVVCTPKEMYDITVEDNHNYFIFSPEDGCLIPSHNCLELVVEEIIGPVVAVSGTTSLVPELELVETGVRFKTSNLWTYSITAMLKDQQRNKIILDHVFEDLKQHGCIIIPTDRLTHVEYLVGEINRRAREQAMINSQEVIAYGFSGNLTSKRKQEILGFIESGQCRVLVSVRSMIKQGIDMKKPTMLYHVIPESASKEAGSPYFYQLTNRVCTPFPGKQQPRVKMFVDAVDLTVACFKSVFGKEIIPGLKMNNHRASTPIYKLNENTRARMYEVLKDRFYRPTLGS